MKKIVISGGQGSFASQLIKNNTDHKIYPFGKNSLDVTSLDSIESVLEDISPEVFIHAGALTRPMEIHDKSPEISIETNIIGTGNVALACMRKNVKLIYISTDFVYAGTDGNYGETDSVLPVNKYAWSKLGGECAAQLCPNSLILRIAMCETPYPHPKALVDMKKSLITNEEAAKVVLKLVNETGVINVGGEAQSCYDFARAMNPDIEKAFLKDIGDVNMPSDASMDCSKMKGKLL
tara:strand:+ start:1006 stop:1713 length:708 start_codon:yes stop_codon:yes gene_type:complete